MSRTMFVLLYASVHMVYPSMHTIVLPCLNLSSRKYNIPAPAAEDEYV